MLWKLANRFYPFIAFDADSGGNAGGSGDSGNESKNQSASGKDNGNSDQDVVRQFKQSELDAMIAERARHAKNAAISDLLKELGVESPDKLKDALKRLADLENKDKTELEKLMGEVKKLQEQINQEKQRADEAIKSASERLMKAEVMAEAQKHGVRSDAIADVWLFVDQSKITEKDGKFEGVKEVVDAVVKAKPYLLESNTKGHGTPRNTGGSQNNHNPNQSQQRTPTRPITL